MERSMYEWSPQLATSDEEDYYSSDEEDIEWDIRPNHHLAPIRNPEAGGVIDLTGEDEESDNESRSGEGSCDICFDNIPLSEEVRLRHADDTHIYCRECLISWVNAKISERHLEITCPEPGCDDTLRDEEEWTEVCERLFRNFVERGQGGFHQCPSPGNHVPPPIILIVSGCEFIGFSETSSQPSVLCDVCDKCWCINCQSADHPGRRCEEDKPQSWIEAQEWKKEKTKKCPGCSTSIEKNGGCPHIVCGVCRHEFCWECMEPYTSGHTAEAHGSAELNPRPVGSSLQTRLDQAEWDLAQAQRNGDLTAIDRLVDEQDEIRHRITELRRRSSTLQDLLGRRRREEEERAHNSRAVRRRVYSEPLNQFIRSTTNNVNPNSGYFDMLYRMGSADGFEIHTEQGQQQEVEQHHGVPQNQPRWGQRGPVSNISPDFFFNPPRQHNSSLFNGASSNFVDNTFNSHPPVDNSAFGRPRFNPYNTTIDPFLLPPPQVPPPSYHSFPFPPPIFNNNFSYLSAVQQSMPVPAFPGPMSGMEGGRGLQEVMEGNRYQPIMRGDVKMEEPWSDHMREWNNAEEGVTNNE
ncbi:putative E3 ubiquitin-protein ligase ARI9 [Planoprotostelium fungivorum]|uniref:RBR-type E3 ubiquitin transferase n=1 Tax=Planoprotostelium fungivorum TaxID=1890364 RepID=A0A2P6NEA2_9EUKA|nr:putative E3 ubiquitin-protein ligase ARI9 [Planoprotostelium fungivorum]